MRRVRPLTGDAKSLPCAAATITAAARAVSILPRSGSSCHAFLPAGVLSFLSSHWHGLDW